MSMLCDYELARLRRIEFLIPIMGGDPALDTDPKLAEARKRHNAAIDEMRKAADAYADLSDDASDEEREKAKTLFDEKRSAQTAALADVERFEEIAAARAVQRSPEQDPDDDSVRRSDNKGKGGTQVREPLTYSVDRPERSWLLDLARRKMGVGDSEGARSRLEAHRNEMRVELKDREERQQRRFTREYEAWLDGEVRSGNITRRMAEALVGHGYQERAVSRIDGSAGEFVPPLDLIDEYAPFLRAGRPFGNAVRTLPLPQGTDLINIPRITTGSLTGFQPQDNQNVTSQDLASAMVAAPVRTLAGQLDVSIQVLEQSPVAFDQIAFRDLAADYAFQLNTALWNGVGGPGQLLGLLNVVGIATQTFTSGSPTAALAYPKIAGALNLAATNRKMPATSLWMHTQRMYWLGSQLDSQNRPLLPPSDSNPMNAMGVVDNVAQGDTPLRLLGCPVHVDLTIPTNISANQDVIVATRTDDHILFEGDMRARVLEEILSGSLGVRFQIYSYVAWTGGRLPQATAVVSGTGLTTPSF